MLWDEIAMEMCEGEKVRIVADKSYFYTCEHPPHIKPKIPLSFDFHLEEMH